MTESRPFALIMRPGVDPALAPTPPPPPLPRILHREGLRIEQNVAVGMRDGIKILIDIYRPEAVGAEEPLPILLAWSPYGKHKQSNRMWPAAEVDESWISPLTGFEAPDPVYWCANGYAVVYADSRGSWYSEGDLRHNGNGEAQDCHDLIEWLAARPGSNGRIGMSGVSYLAGAQWLAASLRPPHLAAINPWECFTDWYREFAYHGGIRETHFIPRATANLQYSLNRTEFTEANIEAHPLHDAYWASKEIELEAIIVPAYVCASWSDHGLHTRGTLEGFKRIGSRQKWLEIHGRKKWSYFYQPASVERQRQFFDHFLKGCDDQVLAWPRVTMEVREGLNQGIFRSESEWPLARTRYEKLFLDAAGATLTTDPVPQPAELRYDCDDVAAEVRFDYRFAEDVELTGHMKLRLWVQSQDTADMDIFVAIQKYDAAGRYVPFVFYSLYTDGPVALGWLRASHRELDPARSTAQQPWHLHTREQPLEPDKPVPVEIEIWPSSTAFHSGEHLRLVIKGRDIYTEGAKLKLPFALHEDTRSRGVYSLHAGGDYDSHLLVPVVRGTLGAAQRVRRQCGGSP